MGVFSRVSSMVSLGGQPMSEWHNKVWGDENWIVNNELYCFKALHLTRDYRCSMHHHKVKDETFTVHSGLVMLEHDDKVTIMDPGDTVRIKPYTEHRFTGLMDSIIWEVSTTHMDEDSYRSEVSGKVPLPAPPKEGE